jgi:type VI secretion system secreted protein VgrG
MYSQQERHFRIQTVLGDAALLLREFSGHESISSPFEFRVGMLSEDPKIDLKALLRTSVTITVALPKGGERHFHGRFSQLRQAGRGEDKLVVYEGVVVPALWFLNLTTGCRIFQELKTQEIVEKLLKENQVNDFRFNLTGSYEKREFCVQYRESDLNFISRLLEDEGIFYYFEHSEGKETLVMADARSAFTTCPQLGSVSYAYSASSMSQDEGMRLIERREAVHTAKVTLTDYNFEKPSSSLKAETGADPEQYDYPGGYLERTIGDSRSKIRLTEAEVPRLTFSGRSNCRTFTSGYKFELEDHYRSDMNTNYVLLSLTHQARQNKYFSSNEYLEPFEYTNTFEAIPADHDFRPARRAHKPAIQGPQTAVVVGKAGEEIWVDKYGRVKVHFFWDRESKKNENSSCWVRVSQAWAGKQWGFVMLPRIGQEVIVDFLEGDPDRPMITGRVYNAEQMPPYSLPDNQTQSGFKSRSSKGGGASNFNEIRLEDKKGSEMFSVQAEKDMETLVKHDQSLTVKNDKTIKIEGKHTETITKDTTITIEQGNEAITLKQGNQSTTLDMGNRSAKIKMGNDAINIDLGKSTTEAMQSIELKVGQSSIKIDQMGVTIKGMMIKIEGTAMLDAKAPLSKVTGDGMLMLKGGLTMIN